MVFIAHSGFKTETYMCFDVYRKKILDTLFVLLRVRIKL